MDRQDLITWRKALHLTQEAAADQLGMSRRAYQALETGETPIDVRTDYASKYVTMRAVLNATFDAMVSGRVALHPLENGITTIAEILGMDPLQVPTERYYADGRDAQKAQAAERTK